MGIYEISEANRKVRTLELKGYDHMLRFEKNAEAGFFKRNAISVP